MLLRRLWRGKGEHLLSGKRVSFYSLGRLVEANEIKKKESKGIDGDGDGACAVVQF